MWHHLKILEQFQLVAYKQSIAHVQLDFSVRVVQQLEDMLKPLMDLWLLHLCQVEGEAFVQLSQRVWSVPKGEHCKGRGDAQRREENVLVAHLLSVLLVKPKCKVSIAGGYLHVSQVFIFSLGMVWGTGIFCFCCSSLIFRCQSSGLLFYLASWKVFLVSSFNIWPTSKRRKILMWHYQQRIDV